ncbi:MAG: phytanoyl-CoA dioxygenase [Phycisphaera sp.]|nr:phytanoyl-CoA dioxygenase [Phycisphaera sp.]
MDRLTEQQWAQYERDGFIKLGKLLSDVELAAMQKRIDDIMLGEADTNYDRMLMQLDSETGTYEDAGRQSRGHKGRTLGYRKIQDLEFDPMFLAFMQRPIFKHICDHEYGPDTPIDCFRAMFMNKPAHKGTFLPWHQDRWTALDRDPLVTIWLALDPATIQNGCVQLIPGTHHSLINPSHNSGFLTKEQAAEHCTDDKRVYLELKAGEVALLHNWTLHGSDVNRSSQSRRAFSVCYMDGRTNGGGKFSRVFGENALDPGTLNQLATR